RCAAHHLKKQFRVSVFDSRRIRNIEKGIRRISLDEAAGKPVIILAVPINRTPSVLRTIAPLLTPGTLVCDVCSVKEQPIRWMERLLPRDVFILGTHPLFGPDSANDSMRSRTIILCPVRMPSARLKHIRTVLERLHLNVVRMSPRHHDRLMATTLFLTQLVGRAMLRLNLPSSTVSTQHFQFLQNLVKTAENDSEELFMDMYRYNRFAFSLPGKLASAFDETRRIFQSRS
ncbi:MAG TPA: prephenate dehydrogenase/arogenate dehydrogenase family protein, partial [Bacteroidota bacterium]|nr:prephenate dehydrogenase/arogenate dehydrogenase family protein [Bacteroidota bacterium]